MIPLVHGAVYFRRLYEELCALRAGDRVFFTDWRGDADERLTDGRAPRSATSCCDLARARRRGPRAAVALALATGCASTRRRTSASAAGSTRPAARCCSTSGCAAFGSHHQKLFVVRHRDARARDVAFVGGIDLCHGRRDDAAHRGRPAGAGDGPALRDRVRRGTTPRSSCAARSSATCCATFTERWDDPHPLDRRTPYRMLAAARRPDAAASASRCPRSLPPPAPAGPHAVQVLRTYGDEAPRVPVRAARRAQHRPGVREGVRAAPAAWSTSRTSTSGPSEVARGIAEALPASPELRVDRRACRATPTPTAGSAGRRTGSGSGGRSTCSAAPRPTACSSFDLENAAGTPIYVHAKVCIVDDVWMTCGSDNFNRRSWTTDSEITCAVVDSTLDDREPADPSGPGDGARGARARAAAAAVGRAPRARPPDDPRLVDPATGVGAVARDRRRARRLARGRPAGPATAGAGPPPRARAADPGTASGGHRGSTGCSSTPTAGPARLRRTGSF